MKKLTGLSEMLGLPIANKAVDTLAALALCVVVADVANIANLMPQQVSTFEPLAYVGMLHQGSAAIILKETKLIGDASFYSFSINELGNETLVMFDTWDQVSQYYNNAFMIKERNRQAVLKTKATEWIKQNFNYKTDVV